MSETETKRRPRKLNLRLEDDLRALIDAAAQESLRPLQREIEYRLRRSFGQKAEWLQSR
jgi:hypothetical protein